MARGQQKIQSQQKAQKKADAIKKQQNHDQKAAAAKALVHTCTVCKVRVGLPIWVTGPRGHRLSRRGSLRPAGHRCYLVSASPCQAQMPDPKTYKQHFENKHPKMELPDDLKAV